MAIQLAGMKEEKSFWVDFDEETSVRIAHVPKAELRAIMKKATKKKYVDHKPVEEFDASVADVLLGQKCIKEWSGVKFNDEEAPCNPENIALLMTQHNKFCDWINAMCVDIDMLAEQQKAETIKNS